MGLWDWSLDAYGRPGVAAACLALQDAHGQNVPLLLWAAWAGLDDADLVLRATALARAWETAAVQPLRQARRGLKPVLAPIDDAAREALRARVQAVELEAERLLLQALEALVPDRGGADVLSALTCASAAWGPAPATALQALAAALAPAPVP